MTVVQQTQDQWYTSVKSQLPGWVFQTEVTVKAYLEALALVASNQQAKVAEHIAATFIMQSAAGTLDTHGAERSTTRTAGELDNSYAVRVQNLLNQSNPVSLAQLINAVLVAGTCRIQEDFASTPFCDSGAPQFCNRAAIFLSTPITNGFSIVVNKQAHAPWSYTSRGYFASRTDCAGSSDSLLTVFTSIIKLGDTNKAMGTLYRVYELLQ